MYKKRNRQQMTVEDFVPPFGGKLNADNRWVKMAKLMPWDMIEEIYAKTFNDENGDGRPPIPSRIAFGALYIKENENFPQRRTMEHISENVYMQYFLGLTEFNPKPLFESSMLSQFANRFTVEDMKKINEEIYRRSRAEDDNPPDDRPPDSDNAECEPHKDTATDKRGKNKGTMILDATVAPADIRYPTDLSILNECRESTEKIIDEVWHLTERKGHKTAYSRKKARKGYLRVAKQRKPRRNQIKQAVREQLECVEKNLETLDRLQSHIGMEEFLKHWGRLNTIREIAGQQRWHYDNPGKSVPNRIVSVSQPHVRPMVRGKARGEVEFGQKISLSIVDGYTFIEKMSWDNFSEGSTLIESAEVFRKRTGVYPEAIIGDTTYRNRVNRNFCKANGIRLSGPRLGRPKASEIEADREQAYKDSCERNIVEGRIGVNKRRYGLDLIYARLDCTGEFEAAMNIICMNVAHLLRVLFRFFQWRCRVVFFGRYAALSVTT